MQKFKRTLGFIFHHPLGKKHPFKALFRFLKWQLQLIIFRKPFIIKPFIANVKFNARKGLTGITGNIYTGLHEFNDMGFLLHLLRDEDIFMDIGANVGSYTLLASGVCQSKSIAFEPIPATFHILTNNIALNNLQDKVKLINAAAGDVKGTVAFSTDQDTTNHVITDHQYNNTMEVPVVVIDELNCNTPILIKIDVEGFEAKVLNGMQNLLKNTALKALIIELGNATQYGFDDNYTHQLLLDHDFVAYEYNPFTRTLNTPATNNTNTIYCRDINFVTNRLNTAMPFVVMGEKI